MATQILKYSETAPKGANVLAVWLGGTVLPSQDVLTAAAATLGEPFSVPYSSSILGDYEGAQGVTLAADKTGAQIASVFAAAAAGQAPVIVAWDPAWGNVVDLIKQGDEFADDAAGAIDALASGASLAINLPRYLAIGGLILGGALVVGGGIYLVWKYKKKG